MGTQVAAPAADGGGRSGFQELPVVGVIEVPPRVGAAGSVGIDVGLYATAQGVFALTADEESSKASAEFRCKRKHGNRPQWH